MQENGGITIGQCNDKIAKKDRPMAGLSIHLFIEESMRYDFGQLLLRLTLASLLLFHGVAKIIHGTGAIEAALTRAGMPPTIAYLVYVGEVVAPMLIAIGLYVRLAAMLVVITMTAAILLVHTNHFFDISRHGGWALELQAFYLLTALVLVLLGAGRYSLGSPNEKWN